MKGAAIVLVALVALAHASSSFDNVDWSTVRMRQPEIPGFPTAGRTVGRIVGGQEATPHQHPYQAALLITAGGGTFFCGGSLISTRDVLTAAHCVDGGVEVQVRLGAHFVQQEEPTQVRVVTNSWSIHPGWNAATIANDIAIVHLPSDVALNAQIQLISLPTRAQAGNNFAGSTATISGWGLDSDAATAISPVLRNVQANVIANLLCNIQFLGMIQASNICTSGAGGVGACSGDSGGPVTVGNIQVGIVSFGLAIGCEVGWPSAHARTTSFLDWIDANSDATIW